MKAAAACCVMTQLIPSISLGKNIENKFNVLSDNDPDFVIINGWVLLKSDVAMD